MTRKTKAFIVFLSFLAGFLGVYFSTPKITHAYSNCIISSFYPLQYNVVSGGTTTLVIASSGCQTLSLTGGTYTGYAVSGSTWLSVGPLYTNTTYVLNGYDYSGNPTSLSATVTVSGSTYGTVTATTLPALYVTSTSATLDGSISGNAYATYYFQYGTNPSSLTNETLNQSTNGNIANVQAYLPNLLPGTTYYYQLALNNTYGTTYGGILSFMTGGGAYGGTTSAITSAATNISAYSAQLNGLILTPTASAATAYFEYGTSSNFGQQTNPSTVSTNTLTNYTGTISVMPNTTYYYALVSVVGGQTYTGATISFTTPNSFVDTTPTTYVTYQTTQGTSTPSSFVSLNISGSPQTITPGSMINYLISYKNIASSPLSNVMLDVSLPTGITFAQTSQGLLAANNTVAIPLSTLTEDQQGTITISGTADATDTPGSTLVATATLAFTAEANAAKSAVAYSLTTVSNANTNQNLAGLALFGNSFFPTTMLGWIAALAIVLILIIMAREFYMRGTEAKQQSVPTVTHIHYPPQNP